MKLIELTLNVCTALGVLVVLFLILAGSLVANDVIQIKRANREGKQNG